MRVNEIFYSIQGEGRYTGTPAIFIRLAGCNLRCDFCDTEHQPYQDLTEEEIMRQIADFPADHVVITGVFNLNSDLRKEFYKLIDLNSND